MNLNDLMHINLGALLRGRVEIGPPSSTQRNATRLRLATRVLSFPRRVIRGVAHANRTSCLRLVTEQLRRIVACNAPLVPALDAVLIDVPYRNVRKTLYRLRNALDAGHSLSEAMLRQTRVFPRDYIDLIRAGENTGSLGRTFDNLIGALCESERLHRAFSLPLSYFAGLLILFTAITTFLCVKVFPVFIEMLKDFGDAPIPKWHRIFLQDIPDFILYSLTRLAAPPVVAVVILLAVAVVWWSWRRGFIRLAASHVAFRTPLLGPVVVKANLGHIARVMEALINAGYPLDEALDTATTLDVLSAFRNLLGRLRDGIRRGESLSAACEREERLLPPWFRGMVSLGETSGSLPASFDRIASLYEREVVTAGMIVSRFVLPAVVLVMAGWVLIVYSYPFVMLSMITDGIISQI